MAKLKLITVGGGQISSSAIVALLAAKTRYLMPDTLLYFHEGLPGVKTEYDLSESRGRIKCYEKRNSTMHNIISAETGNSKRAISDWERASKTFSALEARRHKLVTDVIADPRINVNAKRTQRAKPAPQRRLYAVK